MTKVLWCSVDKVKYKLCESEMKKIKRNEEPAIFSLEEIDPEMDDAVQVAKNTMKDFDVAIKNPENENFALKVRFEHEGGGEFIWLTAIERVEGVYYGEVANSPYSVKELKLGERIRIEREKIADWMFSSRGRLVGGFTIRVLRNRMTEPEREAFDREWVIKIE